MSLILDNIEKHVALTAEEKQLFLSKLEIQQHKAKTILLNSGEICKHSYFVNSGILRSFNINDNIVEHVLNFACEGWWIGDMYSLISQKPGNLFIEVLEDAELVLHQERLMDNLSLSAEERFEIFSKRYSGLIHRIPQKQIASYIGVTPEFFSKMKSKMLRK